jgi:nucleoside-diphosphate-sugar epimerase
VKRVLVTGASGFIGREAPPLLAAAGYDVHTLGRGGKAPGDVAVYHRADLLRDDLLALVQEIAPTHLLHLAWYAESGLFWSATENLDWVAASLRLLRAFAAGGGSRAVIAGSCAEYDWSFPLLDERATPLAPATLYGEAKAALFGLVEKAAPTLGLSFGWGRVFFPYGPFEKSGRLLGGLFDGIARGEQVLFSAGLQQRDFMHVNDVAGAFVALLDSSVEGPVNIASGEMTAVGEIVMRAARIADGEELAILGALPLQPGEPLIMAASTGRLRREVRFIARHSLATGLEDMFRRRPRRDQEDVI